MFCLPYAGGAASAFRTWPGLLPEVEVCPIQLPGRESRLGEQPFTELTALVTALTDALLPCLDVPFALFGHSLGALIAFEVTRDLRRRGAPAPIQLMVSGHEAPQFPKLDPPLHRLPDNELLREIQRLNGTPQQVFQNAELMRMLLPILRADFTMFETRVYTPEDPVDSAIAAYGGLHDSGVSAADLAEWQTQTTGRFRLRMFPGDHFFLHSAQTELMQVISEDLAQASRLAGR